MKKANLGMFFVVGIFFLLPSVFAADNTTYDFFPACSLQSLPSFGGWMESFDASEQLFSCQFLADTVFIQQPVNINREGLYFTRTNPDFWKSTSYSQSNGNIRNVNVTFEYYAPSYNGVCIPQVISQETGFYTSPQMILITNANSNLSQEGTFHDAFIQFNNEVQCDQWRTFTHAVKDFNNDFGSSFSGQSKDIGSLGFEAKNLYIRKIRILGVTNVTVW